MGIKNIPSKTRAICRFNLVNFYQAFFTKSTFTFD